MIGSLLTRGLVMVFGYAYPAYECFKSVEKNKPDIEQLRFWCQYWILVAVLTVCERIGDTFVSWVPMYSETKLAFYIYLWYPKTRGTSYVYDSFFRPYIAKHETDIDRNLLELRTRAGDIAVLYWQKAASYSQTRVYDILQYIASQSMPRPPAQATRARQPAAAPNRKPPAATTEQPQPEEPAISASGSSLGSHPEPDGGEVASSDPSQVPAAPPSPAVGLKAQKVTATKTLAAVITKTPTKTGQAEMMQIEAASSSSTENINPPPPPPQDTIMEEQVRVTRGRLRKTGASLNR